MPDGRLFRYSELTQDATAKEVDGKFLWEFGDHDAYQEFWRRIVAREEVSNRVRLFFGGSPHLFVSHNHPELISPMGFFAISTYQIFNDFTLLTAREAAVMDRVASGMLSREVSRSLHCSQSSVTATMSRIREKLSSIDETALRWEARLWYSAKIDCTKAG